MKGLIAMLLLSSPAASQAMGMRAGPGSCEPMTGTLMVSALYALLAAAGYWVLQHADKETHNCVRRTGVTVGALLVIIGLLGFLCGVATHIKKAASANCCGGTGRSCMMGERPMMPPGPPPAGMLKDMQGLQPPEKPKKAEAAAKSPR